MPSIFGLILFSVLLPGKMWFAPDQPLLIDVKADGAVTLVLTDFTGKPLDAEGPADAAAGQGVDLKTIFPTALKTGGAYVLFAVPKGKALPEFAGTPLVINVREERRRGAAGPIVTKVQPLCYALMSTDQGDMTLAFYYDDAPLTVDNFLTLSAQGFYNGLGFHRIVPRFVIQGGDPRGDGGGGPGYHIQAEFNDRKHEAGVLSMARNGDPHEGPGTMPRPEYADSAGSQFFICLDYERTQSLDRKYTAFGKVTAGMNVVNAIAAVPLADERAGKPQKPPVIKKVEVKPVKPGENPYTAVMPNFPGAAPTTKP